MTVHMLLSLIVIDFGYREMRRTGDWDPVAVSTQEKPFLKHNPSPTRDQVITALQNGQVSLSELCGLFSTFHKDRDVVLTAVSLNGPSLQYAASKLQDDQEVVVAAVQQNGCALAYASDRLRGNCDVVEVAISQNYNAVVFATGSLLQKLQPRVCELLARIANPSSLWVQLPTSIRHHRAIALSILARDGMMLDQMPASIQRDEEAVTTAVENNGDAIRFACRSLRGTKYIALMAVQLDGLELRDLPSAMADNDEVVAAAVRQNPMSLQFASRRLRGDVTLVTGAVTRKPYALMFASDELQASATLAVQLINQNPLAYTDLCRMARQNREIVLAAVSQRGMMLKDVPSEFQRDPGIVLAAITQNGDAIQFASRSLRADKSLALVAVRRDGMELRDLSNALQNDAEVVLAAVTQNGDALQYAGRSLRANKEIALIAVARDGLELKDVSSRLQDDEDVVIAAVAQTGEALQFASSRLRGTVDVVKVATQRNGIALQYAVSGMQCNISVAVPAVTKYPAVFQTLCSDARGIYEIALAACRAHGSQFAFVSNALRGNEYMASIAMATYPLGYGDLPTSVQRDRDVTLAAVTRSGLQLANAPSDLRRDKGIVMAAMKNARAAFAYAHSSLKTDSELLSMLNDELRFRMTGNWGIPLPQNYWVAACPKSTWIPDNQSLICAVCSKDFSTFRRRHHCRACGHILCADCSFVGLAMAGKSPGPHRCCTPCFQASRLHVQARRSIGIPLIPSVERGVAAYHQFLETSLGVPKQYCAYMDLVTAVDIAVILDDSGSMKFPTSGASGGPSFTSSRSGSDAASRWVEMQSILSNMFDVWSWLEISVDVVFMNRTLKRARPGVSSLVSNMSDLQSAFEAPPFGGTPTVNALQKVFNRRINSDAPRPLLTYLFTDGEPDGTFEAFQTFVEERPFKQHSLLSIILCTDEAVVAERYRRMENEVVLMPDGVWNSVGIPGVDVSEDFAGELRDVALAGRVAPLLPGEYLVKCMVGALDPAVHLIDLPAKPAFWRQPPPPQGSGDGGGD